jgi:methionyl-tRNA synthetase
VPQGGEPGPAEAELAAEVAVRLKRLEEHHHSASLRRVTAEIRGIWDLANVYVAAEAPWALRKSDPERAAVVTRTSVDLVRVCAAVAWPIVPVLSGRVLEGLGLEGRPELAPPTADHSVRAVADPGILFAKLDDAWVDAQIERFSGSIVADVGIGKAV